MLARVLKGEQTVDDVDKLNVDKLNWIDGKWVEGDPLIMKAWDQAIWLAAAIFDGARAFDGYAPDLEKHCERAIRSAANLGLKSPLSAKEIEAVLREGIRKFPHGTELYLRPFMWAEGGGLAPDPATTRIVISLHATPLPKPGPFSVCLAKARRPGPDMAPTDAKAVGLYAQAGRAQSEARVRGYDDAVMLGPEGYVAEFAGANLFIVKDSVVITPKPNGTFLNGITRQRVIQLLRDNGVAVEERNTTVEDLETCDEMFSTGNYAKVLPVTRYEQRDFQPGPLYRKARELYWAFAKTQPA
jgi:branched-chain amino acid aminotransferase